MTHAPRQTIHIIEYVTEGVSDMDTAAEFPFLLFEFADREGTIQPLCFVNPTKIIQTNAIDEVRTALQAVERACNEGYYAAGFIAYEAAPAFDPAYAVVPGDPSLPLLWFGLFDKPLTEIPPHPHMNYQFTAWTPAVKRGDFDRQIANIKAAIAQGETYQVNYTMRLRAQFHGDDRTFYRTLAAAQQAPYSAYLNIGRQRILSASPELFFRQHGSHIMTRPMKGTAKRGLWMEDDSNQANWLLDSAKNQAENVMIVDLIRNDLGRIAETGSVHVDSLFAVEAYPTVWQMTSTITATTRADTTLDDVFAALFPCGSITGAPKISTMKKIAELEDSPRGVYCGAVGYMTPDHTRVFNVAIRTVVLDASTGVAEYGAGGGITWNSEAQEEYTETLTKAAILTETVPAFELLETMRLEQGQYALLDRHLRRLAKSARYFDIPLDLPRVQEQLDEHARAFDSFARRVRLLVSQDGQIRIESTALSPSPLESRPVALANRPVSRYNRFLYHKTTCRDVYEALQSEHPDALDVLLWNEQGEITEFTIGNVVLNIRGELLTPARESGLLDGTLRAELLEQGVVRAATITLSELASARQIWLISSVRGWIPVHFHPSSVLSQNVLQR